MRGGLLVVAIVALIGVVIGALSVAHTSRRVDVVQDLFTGLVYYLDDHDGRLPPSKDAFLDAPFVEPLPDGGCRILNREDDRFGREAVGVAVDDLDRYEIPWGVNLQTLTVDKEGAVRNPDGEEVLLIKGGPPLDAVRRFSRDLLRVAKEIRANEKQTSRPTTTYVGPVSDRSSLL